MKKVFAAILMLTAIFIFSRDLNYERSEKMMGTVVTLKASGVFARAAVDESFAEISRLVENVKADVENLNAAAGTGEFVKISPEVFEMLQLSQRYSELTGGAFDVTVGAAVDLWRNARRNQVLPSPEEIAAVRNLVGFKHLQLNEGSARLDLAGVKVNLGGVGKGYGVDLARKIFSRYGITDGLINFGTSSIFAFGRKRIGIRNPRDGTGIYKVIELSDSALSTSGDYEQFFIVDGQRYHHIIDPKTCMPSDNGIASVTVTLEGTLENSGAVADILSTSILILGAENGMQDLPAEIIIIPSNGS